MRPHFAARTAPRGNGAKPVPTEQRVATDLHTAVKQLLLAAPCGGSGLQGVVANYCNVARCLLPMKWYTLDS